jgi:hypothetical protein
MKLIYDKWLTVYDKGKEINVSSFKEIKEMLDRMDQEIYTTVIIGDENEYLSIGGGNGNYIVFYTMNGNYYNLINNNCINKTEEMPLVAGGQEGTFPARQIVNYDLMIQACEWYYRTREMDQKLIWEND